MTMKVIYAKYKTDIAYENDNTVVLFFKLQIKKDIYHEF